MGVGGGGRGTFPEKTLRIYPSTAELDFLFFYFDGIYERFKSVA